MRSIGPTRYGGYLTSLYRAFGYLINQPCTRGLHDMYNTKGNRREKIVRAHMSFTLGAKSFFPGRAGLQNITASSEGEQRAKSITANILGRFQLLKRLRHRCLCQYIDCIRGRHERVFIVSEHYSQSLAAQLHSASLSESFVQKILFQILLALAYLHRNGVVHRNLAAENVLLDEESVKLADYGLYHMTDRGTQCQFPIGYPSYFSAELIQAGPRGPPSSEKSDIWAVGVLAAEMLNGRRLFSNTSDPQTVCSRILDMCRSADVSDEADGSLASQLVDVARFSKISEDFQLLIRMCLAVDPQHRPPAQELLMRPLFASLREQCSSEDMARWEAAPATRTSALHRNLFASSPSTAAFAKQQHLADPNDPLAGKPLADVYHLWKLAGGSVERELASAFAIVPPVCRLPALVPTNASKQTGLLRDRAALYSPEIRPISLSALRAHLSTLPQSVLLSAPAASETTAGDGSAEFTLIGNGPETAVAATTTSVASPAAPTGTLILIPAPPAELPALSIREKDVNYQRTRMKIFRELLAAYPATEKQILEEARTDIPPMLRDQIWAVILGVYAEDVQSAYDAIDKDSEGTSDHQIDLDVPRCHQYNELLASPEGHRKLKRVLKAWVRNHQGTLVYWQGLDSLLAPFLALNLNNEALAWACLEKIVAKFCRDFFRPDNSLFMQQQLLISRQVLAYHDPELAMHLHNVGFNPDMYAIPWFLTLFAHTLPLDKVFVLWDTLLLGSPTLAHFITLAILKEIRSTLLPLDLNACILFFSHLPELDISEVVRSALRLNAITPTSITTKKYALEHQPDPSRWWLARVPLEELSQDMAPRISVADLLKMQPPLLILDIRRPKEFEAVHFDGSVILDHKNPSLDQLEQYRGNPIVIVANKGRTGHDFANILVRKAFPFVSVVHGGIDALRKEAPDRVFVVLTAST